jgi:thiol-disulfide isomerase/thioredoxin
MTLALFLLCAIFKTNAQTAAGYNYAFHLKDAPAQPVMVHFGYWYTSTPYIIDSAMVDSLKPQVRFLGKKNLDPGLYFFNIKGMALPLEFVVNNEPEMAFSTYAAAPLDSFKVAQSIENEPYFYWRTYKRTREQRIANIRGTLELLQRATRDRAVLQEQANKIRDTRDEIDNNTRKQPIKYPNLLFSKIVNAELPAQMPPTIEPVLSDGSTNPEFMQYFRDHFWDGYDFTDARLLRTPTLARKCDDWLQIQPNAIDSVKAALDRAMTKAGVLQDTRMALAKLLMERFDKPSYGGNETMLTYLFDKHMPTAKSVGIDTATWMRVQYKADTYRPTLPGQLAPNIQLPDTLGNVISLHEFNARYTLLYFFSPLCAHCQAATPKVYEQTLPYASKGIKVFAVTTDGKMDYWKNYISTTVPQWTCVADPTDPSPIEKRYGTSGLPNILLLDENKKVLVRRLPIEEIPNLLRNLGE